MAAKTQYAAGRLVSRVRSLIHTQVGRIALESAFALPYNAQFRAFFATTMRAPRP